MWLLLLQMIQKIQIDWVSPGEEFGSTRVNHSVIFELHKHLQWRNLILMQLFLEEERIINLDRMAGF